MSAGGASAPFSTWSRPTRMFFRLSRTVVDSGVAGGAERLDQLHQLRDWTPLSMTMRSMPRLPELADQLLHVLGGPGMGMSCTTRSSPTMPMVTEGAERA